MNKVEWILLMDNNQLTSGALAKAVDIPANGVGNLPMGVLPRLEKDAFGQDPGFHDQPGLECGGGGKQALQAVHANSQSGWRSALDFAGFFGT